jgi:hypothetical protein
MIFLLEETKESMAMVYHDALPKCQDQLEERTSLSHPKAESLACGSDSYDTEAKDIRVPNYAHLQRIPKIQINSGHRKYKRNVSPRSARLKSRNQIYPSAV